MPDEMMIEVCPVCSSSKLYYEVGGYMGKVYHCKDCGYIGAFIVEANEEMIEAIRGEYERKRKSSPGE
jgi:transposase-like protein